MKDLFNMSQNIIPILPNTPPPIDDGEDDNYNDNFQSYSHKKWESDDEFGDFSEPPSFADFNNVSLNSIEKKDSSNKIKNNEDNVTYPSYEDIVDESRQDADDLPSNIHLTDKRNMNNEPELVIMDKSEINLDSSQPSGKTDLFSNSDKVNDIFSADVNNLSAKSDHFHLSQFDVSSSASPEKNNSEEDVKLTAIAQPASQGDLDVDENELASSDVENNAKDADKNEFKLSEKSGLDLVGVDVSSCNLNTVVSNVPVTSLNSPQRVSEATMQESSVSNTFSCDDNSCVDTSSSLHDAGKNSAQINSFDTNFEVFSSFDANNIENCVKSDFPTKSNEKEFSDFADFQEKISAEPQLPSSPDQDLSPGKNVFAHFASNDSVNSTAIKNEDFNEDPSCFEYTQNSDDGDGFDAFADFKSAEKTILKTSFPVSENFASFETDEIKEPPAFADDDDDFGDFGTAESQFESVPQMSPNVPKNEPRSFTEWFPLTSLHQSNSNQSIQPVLDHVEKDLLDLQISSLHHTIGNDCTKILSLPSQSWSLLQDVDNAVALNFQWNSSSSHQNLLKSLDINTQHILFKGGNTPYYVPNYYAAGLGLLQPDFNQTSSGTDKNSFVAPSETVWVAETEKNSGRACSPGSRAPSGGSASPVTNCVNSLDFDLLDQAFTNSSKQRVASSPAQDKLDPELLQLAMDGIPEVDAPKKNDPLARILATLKVSGAKKSDDENESLSDEAVQVLRQLPDLSYMRSRVLMFPVSQSAAN